MSKPDQSPPEPTQSEEGAWTERPGDSTTQIRRAVQTELETFGKGLAGVWKVALAVCGLVGLGAGAASASARFASAAALAEHVKVEEQRHRALERSVEDHTQRLAVMDALFREFREDLHYIRDLNEETARRVGARPVPRPKHDTKE